MATKMKASDKAAKMQALVSERTAAEAEASAHRAKRAEAERMARAAEKKVKALTAEIARVAVEE
jgi:hypothetical protein